MSATATRVVRDPTLAWFADHRRGPDADDKRAVPGRPVFGFLGIPFDYAVSHRPGTRFGPGAIMDALDGYTLYCTDKRVSMAHVGLVDHGHVDVVHSFDESYRRIREAVAAIPGHHMPIILGGDHSITDPAIRGMQERLLGARFGLIVFDAHLDSREPIPGKEHSGHWMKTLEGTFDHRHSVQLGISAPIYGPAYMTAAEAQGVMVKTIYEIRRAGWRETLSQAIAHASEGMDGVYVSVDIDAIDQAFAPGTSVPNPCGLLAHEVVDSVYEIARATPVVALDITEVAPPLDPSGGTAQVAAHIVMSFMAGVTQREARERA
jgi:agmatinase